MKFTAAITATLIGLSSVSALPTKDTLAPQEFRPDAISIYRTSKGKITYNVAQGQISKTIKSGDDYTTLVTFSFPEASRGRTCEFVFETNNVPADYEINGGGNFDVFESNRIVTKSQDEGPTNNLRDRQLGRMKATAGGNAVVQWTDKGFTFTCPQPGKHAYELVPTGDEMKITWYEAKDGAYIRYW